MNDDDFDDDGNNIVPCPICLDNYCPSKEDGKCPEEEELINSYVMELFENHDPRHVVSLAICSHIIGSIIRSSGGLITKEVCLTLIDAGVQLGDDSK